MSSRNVGGVPVLSALLTQSGKATQIGGGRVIHSPHSSQPEEDKHICRVGSNLSNSAIFSLRRSTNQPPGANALPAVADVGTAIELPTRERAGHVSILRERCYSAREGYNLRFGINYKCRVKVEVLAKIRGLQFLGQPVNRILISGLDHVNRGVS